MKIWISGSHACGKSTLCKYVSQKYNIPIVFETARHVLSEQELQIDSLRADIDVSDKYQQQVFDRQLIEEAKHQSFVSDRSALDVLAYSASHTRILSALLKSPELKDYISILQEPSSFIFFVRPVKATLKADGVREAINWDGIVSIDAQIKLLLEMFEIRYFQINTEGMQERVRLIDSVLSLCSFD